jgi:hypothetical protein
MMQVTPKQHHYIDDGMRGGHSESLELLAAQHGKSTSSTLTAVRQQPPQKGDYGDLSIE